MTSGPKAGPAQHAETAAAVAAPPIPTAAPVADASSLLAVARGVSTRSMIDPVPDSGVKT